jgi:UDP-N-acetylmuramate--alanine ligase
MIPPDTHPELPEHVHLVGVGGAGLSGAARLLLQGGHRVSGHDRCDSPFLVGLREQGMELSVGEGPRAPLGADVGLVVRSAAVPDDDPDLVAARERGVPVWKYARLLGALCPVDRTLAVAGTHGKTTVSWLVAYALRGLGHAGGGEAPRRGFLVGGACQKLGVNAKLPEPGGWFAVEACEYDRSFHQLPARGAIVTNVEPDHLDYYGDLEAIEVAFARFCDRVDPDGLIVVGRDVPERVYSESRACVWRLGREFRVRLLGEDRGRFCIQVDGPGWSTPPIQLDLVGSFQVENAALAVALAVGLAGRELGLDPSVAAAGVAREIMRFSGAVRRFERWGTVGGVEVVHDYAHHPTEVQVTLDAARRAFPGHALHVLFQPHQESRTARFLDEFTESLRGVDRVVVSDVYGARRHIDAVGAGAAELAERLRRAGVDAVAAGDLGASLSATLEHLPDRCALLVLGAGDVDTLRDDLLHDLALRRPSPSGARG